MKDACVRPLNTSLAADPLLHIGRTPGMISGILEATVYQFMTMFSMSVAKILYIRRLCFNKYQSTKFLVLTVQNHSLFSICLKNDFSLLRLCVVSFSLMNEYNDKTSLSFSIKLTYFL